MHVAFNNQFCGLWDHGGLWMTSEVASDLKFEISGLNNPCFSTSLSSKWLYLTNLPGKKKKKAKYHPLTCLASPQVKMQRSFKTPALSTLTAVSAVLWFNDFPGSKEVKCISSKELSREGCPLHMQYFPLHVFVWLDEKWRNDLHRNCKFGARMKLKSDRGNETKMVRGTYRELK